MEQYKYWLESEVKTSQHLHFWLGVCLGTIATFCFMLGIGLYLGV